MAPLADRAGWCCSQPRTHWTIPSGRGWMPRAPTSTASLPSTPSRTARASAPTKSNLARLPAALAFDLGSADNGALRVGWMGDSPHTAESLLAAPRDDEERGAVQEAVDVLRSILEAGPTPAKDAKHEARRAGVSDISLKRAKSILGVKSRKEGFTG